MFNKTYEIYMFKKIHDFRNFRSALKSKNLYTKYQGFYSTVYIYVKSCIMYLAFRANEIYIGEGTLKTKCIKDNTILKDETDL